MRRSSVPVRGRHTDTGQAAVELMLTTLFVVFAIFSTVEYMMILYTYSVMADAAKEGVRYAVVHGCGTTNCSGPSCPAGYSPCGDTGGANVVAQVKNYAKLCLHNVSGITVNVNYLDGSASSSSRVQVVIHYPYLSYFSLGWKPPTVNAAAEGRIIN